MVVSYSSHVFFFSRNYKCYVIEQQAIVTTNLIVGENFYSCSDQHMFMRMPDRPLAML